MYNLVLSFEFPTLLPANGGQGRGGGSCVKNSHHQYGEFRPYVKCQTKWHCLEIDAVSTQSNGFDKMKVFSVGAVKD